ncbi:MAG: hypothetical protein J7516_14875 [Shinella sp.]|nr:hypothetical protein [Shinella sp.]
MTPLPHALFALPPEHAIPADRRGVLVPAARIGEAEIHGAIVVVETDTDIATLQKALTAGAAMIALAGCRTGADLQRLATLLSVAEAEVGCPEGSTSILAMTDGILPAPGAREGLARKSRRLAGLVWDLRLLVATLRATRTRTRTGELTTPLASARAATLLTATVADVPVYDSLPDVNEDALVLICNHSRTDGFFGSLAIRSSQIEVVETQYASLT